MTIRFDSGDGRFVRLDVVGYESDLKGWPPDIWLMVELHAFDGQNEWHRQTAALETHDVPRLAQFLRDAAAGRDLPRWGWGATEPDIELTIEQDAMPDQHRVTVRLNCHFHRDYVGEPCHREWLELPFFSVG